MARGRILQCLSAPAWATAHVLHRTLRRREKRRCADSLCELGRNGPAARSRVVILVVTSRGAEHLQEWIPVSNHMSKSMNRFVREARTAGGGMAFRQKTNRDVEVEC